MPFWPEIIVPLREQIAVQANSLSEKETVAEDSWQDILVITPKQENADRISCSFGFLRPPQKTVLLFSEDCS